MASVETARGVPGEGVRLAGWGVLALAVVAVRDRFWATPNLAFFLAIAKHLGTNPFPKGLDGDYLLTNLTGPVVARTLGQTSPQGYVRLHLAVLVLGLAGVAWATFRRFGYRVARALLAVLAASPAVTVCTEWLGQPDVFTLCLALAIALCRRRWPAFAFAVLLGLTHFEQGVFAALAATVVHSLLDEGGVDGRPADPSGEAAAAWWQSMAWWGGTLLGGVVVGRAVTEIYLRANDIVIRDPRTKYLDLGASGFAHFHARSPVTLAYSLWGPLWLVLAWLAWRWWRSGRSWGPVPTVLLVAGAGLVPVAVTLDETRVYSLITAPLLLAIAVLVARSSAPPEPGASEAPGGLEARPAQGGVARTWIVGALIVALAALPGEFNAGDAYWATALHVRQFDHFLWDGTIPGGPGNLTTWLLGPFPFKVPSIHSG